MAETIILDPPAVAAGRTQLDITTYIAGAGVNWGDAAIQAYLADMEVGSSPVDYRIPNRQITMPLSLRTVPGQTFDQIRTSLQQKLGLWQRENGWLMRTLDGAPVYADVTNATLHLGGSWLQAFHDVDVDAVLTLDARPDWYGDEITLADHVETVASRLVFTEPWIAGNYPGRVRIVVDNDSVSDQHALLWGLRSRYYDSSATAALSYEAESLTLLNGATSVAKVGASGGNVVQSGTPMPAGTWVGLLGTTLASGAQPLTHKGSYRVWVRAAAASTPSLLQLRLQWGIGGLSTPGSNNPVALQIGTTFSLVDLGVIRLDPAPVGVHQWFGVIQMQTAVASDAVQIDHVYLQPLDDGAGRLTYNSRSMSTSLGIATQSLTSGTITSQSGGNTPWILQDNPGAIRVVCADATFWGFTNHARFVNWGFTVPANAQILGLQIDAKGANGLIAQLPRVFVNGLIVKNGVAGSGLRDDGSQAILLGWGNWIAGGPTDLLGSTLTAADVNNPNFGFELWLQWYGQGGEMDLVPSLTVYYQLSVSTGFSIANDAVVYASRSVELRTEGMVRAISAGNVYGPVSTIVGDLPRVPPSGLEGRAVEVFIKASRGDLVTESDSAIDDISARVIYRPSYLYTP